MKGIELEAGSQAVSQAWRWLGIEMTTIDHDPTTNPDICCDWADLDPGDYQDVEIVWFSPDCRVYSVMSFPQGHFKDGVAVSEAAIQAEASNIAALAFIEAIQPSYWVMENPRALMRKRPWVQELDRFTVSYCQYRPGSMKPTDLFGVLPQSWEPKMCKNGDPCHTPAPRGSRTGTQGNQTAQERAIVPFGLAADIARCAIRDLHGGWVF